MKILLLGLVLGLLLAGQSEAQQILSQLSGEWRTHYIAASNKELITENGSFHIYFRYVEFDEEDDIVEADFYLKSNGECNKKHVTGEKKENFAYNVEYAGQNEVQILHVSENSIIGHMKNVDEDGKETDLVGIIGTDDKVSDSDFERFKEETRQKGTPEENIMNFINNEE